jgi:hypothetical protein
MKKGIFTLLLLTGICLSSCKKDSVTPKTTQSQSSPNTVTGKTILNQTVGTAAADTANGYLRIQLAKDAVNTDDIIIDFKPSAKTTYVVNEDARYFTGFGEVSLSSLSSDNIPLAINVLPLSAGRTIALKVSAKTDGIYKLNMLQIADMPAKFDIWLKDSYMKDSLDIKHNSTYAFNLKNSDTTTYGSHRFTLVLRKN